MAGERSWIDLLDKALIPITGIILTAGLAWSQDVEHKHQACLDSEMSLIQFVCGDKDNLCHPSSERSGLLPHVVELVKARCEDKVPVALADFAVAATSTTGNADATAKVSAAAGLQPSVAAAPLAAPPALAPARPDTLDATKAPAAPQTPRLYIQIRTEDQRPAAQQLSDAVSHSSLNGMTILTPGIELVANSGVKQTELRCVTKVDCAQAPDLAAFLGALLGSKPLPIRDLSVRYEGRTGTRPNHFELWFGPGAISLPPTVTGKMVANVKVSTGPASDAASKLF